MLRNTVRKREGGSAVIEFALGSTLLFLILGGVSDLGRIFYYSEIVSNAARAGVQYGMISVAQAQNTAGMQAAALAEPGTLTGLTASATSYCQCPNTSGNVSCTTSACSDGSTPRLYAQVTTSYPFTTVVSWPGIANAITLNGLANMRVR